VLGRSDRHPAAISYIRDAMDSPADPDLKALGAISKSGEPFASTFRGFLLRFRLRNSK
jgi:hypothetical protein